MFTRPVKRDDPRDLVPEWNNRFACKDPSEFNLAYKGNLRAKQYFMRPQSLPELARFYDTYEGFESNRRSLAKPEAPPPKLVLSTDSVMLRNMPGRERHMPGGCMTEPGTGEVLPWREQTPRALKPQVWEPGTLLLRMPFGALKSGPPSEAYPPPDFERTRPEKMRYSTDR